MVDIKKLSEHDLKQKIKKIKMEREKTDSALQKYEKELERRNKAGPLGVPLEDKIDALFFGEYNFGFTSIESEHVFCERLKYYVEALRKLARGEPIDIKALAPLMKKGWAAMDICGHWIWFDSKPYEQNFSWYPTGELIEELSPFNIQPAEDWKQSLVKCGL